MNFLGPFFLFPLSLTSSSLTLFRFSSPSLHLSLSLYPPCPLPPPLTPHLFQLHIFSPSLHFSLDPFLSRCRIQEERKERHSAREKGILPLDAPELAPAPPRPTADPLDLFKVEEYKDTTGKGSFDTGDPLSTNIYVGNINPKVGLLHRGGAYIYSYKLTLNF